MNDLAVQRGVHVPERVGLPPVGLRLNGPLMPKKDPRLTRAEIEAMSRFAEDVLRLARARARDRGLTPAEIEAEEIDDDPEFWDDVRTMGRPVWPRR